MTLWDRIHAFIKGGATDGGRCDSPHLGGGDLGDDLPDDREDDANGLGRPAAQHPTDALWRELCRTEYRIEIIHYGNDGHPAGDISPRPEEERAADLADRLAWALGVSSRKLQNLARAAAYAHGRDRGLDTDPDRFAPPRWSELQTAAEPTTAADAELYRAPDAEGANPDGVGGVDEQHHADSYTRGPITRWRVGDRYSQPYGGGRILRVHGYAGFMGSTPTYSRTKWEPVLSVERLREVPGDSYKRIRARTFLVPAATIAQARELAEDLDEVETRENTPLSFQGYGEATDDPGYRDLYPADVRDEAADGPWVRAEERLRVLWDGIEPRVRADLLADWHATGKRRDHPTYPFTASGTAQLDAVED